MLTTVTGLFPGLARLGVTQLINGLSDGELPAQAESQVRADLSTAAQARSERDELAMVPTMMAQARAVTDLVDLPLYVLTAPVDAQPIGSDRKPSWPRCRTTASTWSLPGPATNRCSTKPPPQSRIRQSPRLSTPPGPAHP